MRSLVEFAADGTRRERYQSPLSAQAQLRKLTRSRLARLLFLLTERDLGHVDRICACRRPVPRLITDAIREAMDDVEEAVQQEPDLLGEYLETGD